MALVSFSTPGSFLVAFVGDMEACLSFGGMMLSMSLLLMERFLSYLFSLFEPSSSSRLVSSLLFSSSSSLLLSSLLLSSETQPAKTSVSRICVRS